MDKIGQIGDESEGNFWKRTSSGLATTPSSLHIQDVSEILRFGTTGGLLAVACLVVLSGLASCRILPETNRKTAVPSPAISSGKLPIGVIELVDGAGGFVLIKSSRMVSIEPESILDVVGDGGLVVAQVKLSPARKGQFLTADIISGMPVKGQSVLTIYQTANPAEAAQNGSAPPGIGDEIQVLE